MVLSMTVLPGLAAEPFQSEGSEVLLSVEAASEGSHGLGTNAELTDWVHLRCVIPKVLTASSLTEREPCQRGMPESVV